jgi:biopolymer transport protein ExbD
MASAGGAPSKGRRRNLDAELNLVPFIDLLSTCICFLLMTVVWMEIGSLQVKQATGNEAAATPPQSLEMDVKFLNQEKLELSVKGAKKSQKFAVEAKLPEDRLKKLDSVLGNLPSLFKLNPAHGDIKAQMGQLFSVARVTTTTGVTYGDMVAVMDELRDHGIVNLGVVPVRK